MDKNVEMLVTKLAESLGTTAEHLWGVLVRQAPINSVIDIGLLVSAFFFLRYLFGKQKTVKPDKLDMVKPLMFTGLCLAALVLFVLAFDSAAIIMAGFFNPEYWALVKVSRLF